MAFPEHAYQDVGRYRTDYLAELSAALGSVDPGALRAAADLLAALQRRDGCLFACGNGGSASIANHLLCDHTKGVANGTGLRPRARSLSCNTEIITAIANDHGYAEVFARQLELQARPGDLVMTISSSGNSENVVRALRWALEHDLPTIALTGFSGGRTRADATVALHIDSHNYGVVEDAHQALMHLLAQFLRQRALAARGAASVAETTF